jgi:hypothetical protein
MSKGGKEMAKYSITNDNKARIVAELERTPSIPYWRLAMQLGVHENTLTRYMRMPNDEQTALILDAIQEIRETDE